VATREVRSEIPGNVWKIECATGTAIAEGDTVMILESMKMEIPVDSPAAGTVLEIRVNEGDFVAEDDVLLVLES